MNNNQSDKSKSFKWLNATQFLGALNDNVFQLLVIFFLTSFLSASGDKNLQTSIMTTATVVFVLPFLIFSHAAGVLADRFSKRNIIVFSKYLELAIMAGGFIAIMLPCSASAQILYFLIFLMCTQSTIFGPSKYGIIPELVAKEQLSRANSSLVALTYLAIIFGTFLPSLIIDRVFPGNYRALSALCLLLAGIGVITSIKINHTDAAKNKRPFTPLFVIDIFKTMKRISSDRDLFLAVIGSAYFMFIGAFIKLNILLYGQECLGLSMETSGYLFPVAALGIGVGAIMAGKVSGRNIEFGIVPVGAMGLTLSCILLSVNTGSISTTAVLIALIGISSGLFIVPLDAFIQYRSPAANRGEILACQNFLSFTGVAVAAFTLKLLASIFHLSASQSFMVVGILTGLLAVYAVIILPDFLIRFVVVALTKCVYRIRTYGVENVPSHGPALLVSNHVTWVDALLIAATQQRRIRYIMAREIYNNKFLNPLFKLMGVIPISPDDPPRQIVTSLKQAGAVLDDGMMVCIFAEGAITRNGNMQEFKSGFERIVKNTTHPVIPVYIGGAWGSIFSYSHGKLLGRLPSSIPYNISILFGKPMPPTSSSAEVRQAVLELSSEFFHLRKTRKHSLPEIFVTSARKWWSHHAMSDTTGKELSYGQTLTASIAIADEIKNIDRHQKYIGVLLPPSVGAAITNIAIHLLGKIPVNINFTASRQSIKSALDQCEIKTIISSRAFLEKFSGIVDPEQTVMLEDITSRLTLPKRIKAFLKAIFAPVKILHCHPISGPDDIATIIFSSGSTGQPKGIMLSHYNIISNIEGFRQVFRFQKHDRMCGVLPFFHSFGYTATLWCPLLTGFSVAYHNNPIDGAKIAEIVRDKKLTTLLSTPTFLLSYIRRAEREHFASLKHVIVGAEKLKKRIADAFHEKFGIRPLEGYGATELSPVGSVNIPDVTIDNISQTGTKEGSIGHPIPGVTMKIVDPESKQPLPFGKEGLLLVKGPNVMPGYLNNPEKNSEVIRDGWYDTGDIAVMDADGFVFLLDRMSRYSKIGGEMVPHLAIEEKLMQNLNSQNQAVFVSSVSDETKGEQLVVLYTAEAGHPDDLHSIIEESDLPNLWRPKKHNYFKIETMPMLGSGKLDLKRLKELALDFTSSRTPFDCKNTQE